MRAGLGNGRSTAVAVLAVLALGSMTPGAFGQDNSLRKRGERARRPAPAPTTQPAAGPREVLLPAPPRRPLTPGVAERADVPNPWLLQSSLIAVQPPEPRKIQAHDLVTIIVREDKRSTSDAKLESEKQWDIETALRKWFRLDEEHRLVASFPLGQPGVDFEFDNQYEGEGKTQRKDTLITRITAQVIDVKPNGVLALEAKKSIEVDEDVQVYTLTGACRSEDISAQNTILSTQLAEAHISVQHTGPARDAARRGWLMRLFDLLRPL